MTHPLLVLENLSIAFGDKQAVHDLNLEVRAGERVALVGESGSGKTVTALSILRLLQGARVRGRIRFQGEDLLSKSDAQIRQIRGGDVAMIFQEPSAALNPVFTIGNQIIETLVLHAGISAREARKKAIELLARTGIRQPERRIDSYPHQLSGGQLQRAVIAMALACRPKLLIADEPTTALDPTVRERIVQLLLELQQEESLHNNGEGMAILLITHDLNLVRRFAQRVAVMERGKLVESGAMETVFARPKHPYTELLINSLPARTISPVSDAAATLLQTRQLRVEYAKKRPGWRGWFGSDRFVALAHAEISLREGETIGVVGESGSGKSTLAQAILDLISIQGGSVEFAGTAIAGRSRRDKRALRASLQVVFQDPLSSLSPRQNIEQIVGEGLALHFPELSPAQRHNRIVEILHEVGLPERVLNSFPHEFSGGQRQRIAIARAVVLRPKVLVLDEPTSALDASIQNQVLQLLVSLQRKYGISYVLISHDMAVVNALSHRIYVMKDGEIITAGDTEAVIASARSQASLIPSYTQRLIQASL